jgi:hypothetical protein
MQPLTSAASPEGWGLLNILDASRPRRAIEHVGHSEVSKVTVDVLRPRDKPPDFKWALTRYIPIIMIDTLDAYWVLERVINKLHGFSRTPEEAKMELMSKLGGHLQLLSSLESPRMAPILRLELEFLRVVLRPLDAVGPDTTSSPLAE